jgi:hypothetical protein
VIGPILVEVARAVEHLPGQQHIRAETADTAETVISPGCFVLPVVEDLRRRDVVGSTAVMTRSWRWRGSPAQ